MWKKFDASNEIDLVITRKYFRLFKICFQFSSSSLSSALNESFELLNCEIKE